MKPICDSEFCYNMVIAEKCIYIIFNLFTDGKKNAQIKCQLCTNTNFMRNTQIFYCNYYLCLFTELVNDSNLYKNITSKCSVS